MTAADPVVSKSIVDAIKQLRAETNCPLMDVKSALVDANGDFDKAKSLLRERLGSLDVTKKDAGTEGVIAITILKEKAAISYAIVELATETDFAARSPQVIETADLCAENILMARDYDRSVEELRGAVGENVFVRRADSGRIEEDPNFAFSAGAYVHHDRRSGAYVIFSSSIDAEPLTEEVARSIAMHVVAATPIPVCVQAQDVPEALVEAERMFLSQKAQASGKPQAIQDKIVEGGLSKFRASRALLEQPFIRDPSKKVRDVLPKGVTIFEFDRWEIGQ